MTSMIRCITPFFLSLLVSSSASAIDQSQLNLMESAITKQVCSDGGEWLKCYSMKPSDCQGLGAVVVRPCLKSELSEISQLQSEKEVAQTGAKLTRCFNEVFMGRYGAGKLGTAECTKPPTHLQ